MNRNGTEYVGVKKRREGYTLVCFCICVCGACANVWMHSWAFVQLKCGKKLVLISRSKGKLTLFMYSLNKSWRACRTALHSATMRSRRSSRVQEESAMSAAPLMMLSKRSSKEGRKRASLNVRGSRIILFCRAKWHVEHQHSATESAGLKHAQGRTKHTLSWKTRDSTFYQKENDNIIFLHDW